VSNQQRNSFLNGKNQKIWNSSCSKPFHFCSWLTRQTQKCNNSRRLPSLRWRSRSRMHYFSAVFPFCAKRGKKAVMVLLRTGSRRPFLCVSQLERLWFTASTKQVAPPLAKVRLTSRTGLAAHWLSPGVFRSSSPTATTNCTIEPHGPKISTITRGKTEIFKYPSFFNNCNFLNQIEQVA